MKDALDRLSSLAVTPVFAYGSILLIQLKRLWGIWQYRDLSPGDTASYFVDASQWVESFQLNPAFYPLYTVFYGSFEWVFSGAFETVIAHRVAAALAVSVLVLAVLRRLLSPGIAWMLAVAWVVNPVNFDTLYEVHLFAMVWALAIVLLALNLRGRLMRSVVFGALLASALLVRNEYVIAAGLWVVVWLGYELWQRQRDGHLQLRPVAIAVVAPVLSVAALFAAVAALNSKESLAFAEKHELNVCQVYAQGQWQGGDILTGNPHAECGLYMERDFGDDRLSLTEALAENPGAMLDHFATNAALIPYGLQVDLFNEMSGSASWSDNPDYVEVRSGSRWALLGSVIVLGVLIAGLVLLWRERRRWWPELLARTAWGWVAILSLAGAGVYAALLTRPRPQYMFTVSFLLLALIGVCLVVLVARMPALGRLRAAIPLVTVVLLLLPSRYTEGYASPQTGPGQGLKTAVERAESFGDDIAGEERGLFARYPNTAICEYVGGSDPCSAIPWDGPTAAALRQAVQTPLTNPVSGEGVDVDLVYADEVDLAVPGVREALAALDARGWDQFAPSEDENWVLLRRSPSAGDR